MSDENIKNDNNFSSKIVKKMNIAKQYALQKMGKVESTEESPAFKEMAQRYEVTKKNYEEVSKISRQSARQELAQHTTTQLLGECWMEVGTGQENTIGAALCKFGEAEKTLSEFGRTYVDDVNTRFVNPVIKILEEVQEIEHIKKRLGSTRLAYDATQSRLKNAQGKEKEPAKLQALEQDFNAAKEKYETTVNEMVQKMENLEKRRDEELLQELCSYMSAQKEYHSKCLSLLQEIEPFWLSLQTQENTEN